MRTCTKCIHTLLLLLLCLNLCCSYLVTPHTCKRSNGAAIRRPTTAYLYFSFFSLLLYLFNALALGHTTMHLENESEKKNLISRETLQLVGGRLITWREEGGEDVHSCSIIELKFSNNHYYNCRLSLGT